MQSASFVRQPFSKAGWIERPTKLRAFWNFRPASQYDRTNPYVGLLSACSTVAPKPDQTLYTVLYSCSALAQSAVRTLLRVCIVRWAECIPGAKSDHISNCYSDSSYWLIVHNRRSKQHVIRESHSIVVSAVPVHSAVERTTAPGSVARKRTTRRLATSGKLRYIVMSLQFVS